MARSEPQLTARCGSAGLEATATTFPVCPVSEWRSRPVATSHTRTACEAGGKGWGVSVRVGPS